MSLLSKYWREPRYFALLLAVISALAIGSALVMQYGFGLYPCTLCIYQRIPYALLILLGIGAFCSREPTIRKLLLVMCFIALLAEFGLALYHVGVEEGIFEGTSTCSPDTTIGTDLDDLKAMIEAAPIASCKDKPAELFGFSIAGWNALLALLLIKTQLYMWVRNRKGAKA